MERKLYSIHSADSREAIFSAPEAEVGIYGWKRGGYEPECRARLIYLREKGFLCRMDCAETAPKADETEEDGEVYKDSCMELFVNFAPEQGERYLNLEANARGTLHCKLGDGRHGRTSLFALGVPRPELKAELREDGWSVEFFIRLETIRALYGKEDFSAGDTIRLNFYKCGDATDLPHYGAWSRVETPEPDFHRPEWFGTGKLT